MRRTTKKYALLSVFNKDGLLDIAKRLISNGYTLISTGGTAKALRDGGLEVLEVAEVTKFPEILGDLVKTLHPRIHGGLLAPRTEEAQATLTKHRIKRIHFLYVSIYELLQLLAKGNYDLSKLVGSSDMGGPAMIASGAKGALLELLRLMDVEGQAFEGPVVACSLAAAHDCLNWIEQGQPDQKQFILQMAATAFFVCGAHRIGGAIAFSEGQYDALLGIQTLLLSKGENGWQSPAAFYATDNDDPFGMQRIREVFNRDPGYNGIIDIHRAQAVMTHIAAVFEKNGFGTDHRIAVAVKHGNPCGAAIDKDPIKALRHLVEGDPRALFGGTIAGNFALRLGEAIILREYLTGGIGAPKRPLGAVLVPEIDEAARLAIRRKDDGDRIYVNENLFHIGLDTIDQKPIRRQVRGGYLLQPNYTNIFDLSKATVYGPLDDYQIADLLLAWAICSMSNSNTITITKGRKLVGNGVGQQDRVTAANLAVQRAHEAGHDTEGAVASSDSFFPFPDGLEVLAKAGIKVILCTTGSKNDPVVKEAAAKLGVTLVQVTDAEGRMFYGH